MAYPIEALLRPAHELRSAAVSALGAVVVLATPGTFLERGVGVAVGRRTDRPCRLAWRGGCANPALSDQPASPAPV